MVWSKEHVGMVHWCSYWRKYSLVLDVDSSGWVTELDSFSEINSKKMTTRRHCTDIDVNDMFFTVSEFCSAVVEG